MFSELLAITFIFMIYIIPDIISARIFNYRLALQLYATRITIIPDKFQ